MSISPTLIVELAIDGVARGLLLALLGAGITMVFGLGEVLNLAQGIFAVLGALLALEAINSGILIPAALMLGIIGVGALGFVIDQVLLSSVYRSEGDERILVAIFVTLGLTLALEGILFQFYSYSFALPIDTPRFQIFGLSILGTSVMNIVVASIILAALFAFLRYTYVGKAARTLVEDEVGATLCGVNARRMRTIIFVLSAMLAAAAGILWGITTNLSPASGFDLAVKALIVSIVGGVRNIPGTVIAGIGLGVVLTFANLLIGTYLGLIAMFVAAMIALVVRQEVIA